MKVIRFPLNPKRSYLRIQQLAFACCTFVRVGSELQVRTRLQHNFLFNLILCAQRSVWAHVGTRSLDVLTENLCRICKRACAPFRVRSCRSIDRVARCAVVSPRRLATVSVSMRSVQLVVLLGWADSLGLYWGASVSVSRVQLRGARARRIYLE